IPRGASAGARQELRLRRGAGGRGLVVGAPAGLPELPRRARALDEVVAEPRPDRAPSVVVLAPAEPAVPGATDPFRVPGYPDPAARSAARGLGHGQPGAGCQGEPHASSGGPTAGRNSGLSRAGAGLEAAVRCRRARSRAVPALGAALVAARAVRRPRGLGRRVRLEPERAHPRLGRRVARPARLLRGSRAVERSREDAGAAAGGGLRPQLLRVSLLHPLGKYCRAPPGAAQSPAGPRRPARGLPLRGLRLRGGRSVVALLGPPRADAGRGLGVPSLGWA